MKLETKQIEQLRLTDVDSLDPITIICEDFGTECGKITIECYGKVWTAYWGATGEKTIAEFFCNANEHYIANKLSSIDSTVYDIDAIRKLANERGIECWRDDPWNDYGFLNEMFGPDMSDWADSLPKETNPDYDYLCRIIRATQEGLKMHAAVVHNAGIQRQQRS